MIFKLADRKKMQISLIGNNLFKCDQLFGCIYRIDNVEKQQIVDVLVPSGNIRFKISSKRFTFHMILFC